MNDIKAIPNCFVAELIEKENNARLAKELKELKAIQVSNEKLAEAWTVKEEREALEAVQASNEKLAEAWTVKEEREALEAVQVSNEKLEELVKKRLALSPPSYSYCYETKTWLLRKE